jgi:Zn-dependent peptidase ImmA (M78 family)
MRGMGVRRKYIRQVVKQLLESHRVDDAPVPVDKIAIAEGADIRHARVEDDLSGFIYRQGPAGAIIGVNEGHHPNRQRFTVAHELGHMLLHSADTVRTDLRLRFRRDQSVPSPEEVEANHFAAELLMPEQFLERDLDHYDFSDFMDDTFEDRVLEPLATKYGVSKQAMTIRLQSLGYIFM